MASNLQSAVDCSNVTHVMGTISCKRFENVRSVYNHITKAISPDTLTVFVDYFKLTNLMATFD